MWHRRNEAKQTTVSVTSQCCYQSPFVSCFLRTLSEFGLSPINMTYLFGALFLGLCGLCLGAGGGVSGGSAGGSAVGSLTDTEDTRLLRKDQQLILTCNNSTSSTSEDTEWTKNGDPLIANEHIKILANGTVYIESVNRDDVGDYQCKAPGMKEFREISVVELTLHKHLPKSTTVLENDKLSINCQVEGHPMPQIQWLKNGEPLQDVENSTRLVFSENEYSVPNATLLIKPLEKADAGNYVCSISVRSLQLNTATDVRVKDIYAALWPFLGIVAEVVLLCIIIFIYEKRRIKPNLPDSDSDNMPDQKNMGDHNKEAEVRQRK